MSDLEDSTVTYTAAPPSPDYVPGPEELEQAPLSPEFVPEPVYPEFMPPEDEVFPAEEHPLPAAVSPTTDSPGYIADFDPEEDEEDPEEDITDYPADGGDDDDDDDEMSVRAQTPISLPSDTEVARLLAIPTPPPSPLSLLSSPLLPQLPSPSLPVSSPLPVSPPPLPASPTHPLGYRAAMIRLRAESPSTSHSLLLPPPIILSCTRSDAPPLGTPPSGTPPLLPIPAPTSSPHLLLPSTDHRADKPKVCLPPRKRLCIALGPRYEIGERLSAPAARSTEVLLQTMVLLPLWIGRLGEIQRERQDTDEIYGRLDEAQEARAVLSGRLNLLGKDKRSHAYTSLLMEREARLSRQQAEIVALRATDDARRAQLMETLRLMRTLQTHVTALQRQLGPARGRILKNLFDRPCQNGDDSHNSGIGSKRTEQIARECTYTDFIKCQPLNFKGTEGVAGLSQWFEKWSLFSISVILLVENKVKFVIALFH
ncbi:hypothetical protein Tco_0190963 [Tanacetum coccineum]